MNDFGLVFMPTGVREHMLSFLSRSEVLTFRTTHRTFQNDRAAWSDFFMDENFPFHAHLFVPSRVLNISVTGSVELCSSSLVYAALAYKPESIQIGASVLKNNGLKLLARFNGLEHLDIFDCRRLTDQGLAHVTKLSSLKELRIGNCFFSDAGVQHIATLVQLESLGFFNLNQITNAGLAHLRPLFKLQSFDLQGCQRITDAGLVHITQLPLKSVHVWTGTKLD